MIILAASDFIAGVASVAAQVTVTIFGMELNGATETYKVLYQGQLPSSVATIYTATGVVGLIKSISVVNNDTSARWFNLYRGGTATANEITTAITIPANGQATYEDGVGWSITTIPAGTTITNPIFDGYQDWNSIALPAAPGANVLRMYARNIGGRMLPKWTGPSGVDTFVQPSLFGNVVSLFTPTSGTTVTGGFGSTWAKGGSLGTVSTPTQTNTSPAVTSQIKRTRHANVITTTNQAMGIIATAAGSASVWRGDAAGLGGFYFHARFVISGWPANTCRLFCGLTAGTAEVVASDTVANNTCGFWHDITEGANILSFVTRDAATTTKTAITGGQSIAAGQGFDAYIFAKPNDTTIYYRLDSINAGTTLVDSSIATTLPVNTVFLGPQVEVSNGTANITANTVMIDVARIYLESDK
jgi:hypothetical protein